MKISVILPFFCGELPNYFRLWLSSANHNQEFNFLLFTDKQIAYEIPKNVHVETMTFHDMQELIRRKLGNFCSIKSPYKLCDYKPSYGLVFSDYLKDSDWWGYCDPDIIWGDLSAFILPEMLQKYDRILLLGHLSLYRNTQENNSIFKKNGDIPYTAKEAMLIDKMVGFDEAGCRFLAEQGYYSYVDFKEKILDIWPSKFKFRSYFSRETQSFFVSEYDNGRVFALIKDGDKVTKEEFAYIHLQKRRMNVYDICDNHFLIVPNAFVSYNDIIINADNIMRLNALPEGVTRYNNEKKKKEKNISVRIVYVEIRRRIRLCIFRLTH